MNLVKGVLKELVEDPLVHSQVLKGYHVLPEKFVFSGEVIMRLCTKYVRNSVQEIQ